jgi:hypothetical protein
MTTEKPYFHPILDADRMTDEQIREFMTKLGFVETNLAGETVYMANLSVSIRVNTTKGFNTLNCLKTEIYKRVSYYRNEFLNSLDSIMLFCLSNMEAFDSRYTKQDIKKRASVGIDQVKVRLIEHKKRKKKEPDVGSVFDL